jgi:hypothetical protein
MSGLGDLRQIPEHGGAPRGAQTKLDCGQGVRESPLGEGRQGRGGGLNDAEKDSREHGRVA